MKGQGCFVPTIVWAPIRLAQKEAAFVQYFRDINEGYGPDVVLDELVKLYEAAKNDWDRHLVELAFRALAC